MADFTELLGQLMNPGEEGTPPTIYDDLSASYTDATSTRDAKISESGDQLAALMLELQAAKAMNYDLMMSQVGDSGDSGDNDSDDDSDGGNDDSDVGDDSDFFTDKD